MMTKLEKCAARLNDAFRGDLHTEMKSRFDIDVQTEFNFMSMQLVTTKSDGTDFTPEQFSYLSAYSDGYSAALTFVRGMAK
jgi:hypothetical protein